MRERGRPTDPIARLRSRETVIQPISALLTECRPRRKAPATECAEASAVEPSTQQARHTWLRRRWFYLRGAPPWVSGARRRRWDSSWPRSSGSPPCPGDRVCLGCFGGRAPAALGRALAGRGPVAALRGARRVAPPARRPSLCFAGVECMAVLVLGPVPSAVRSLAVAAPLLSAVVVERQ